MQLQGGILTERNNIILKNYHLLLDVNNFNFG